jgi:hypothetical protein
MKLDISKIINMSFFIKDYKNDSNCVEPIHVRLALEILYPKYPDMLFRASYFLEHNPKDFKLNPKYDLSDIYLINKSYNFGKGSVKTVKYIYGLIMDI